MKSAGNRGVVHDRLQVLHVHVFLAAPLSACHVAQPRTDQHQGGVPVRERPQNERHNGLFRTFVPKGVSIEAFSAEYILAAADELNGRPRKKLGYRTPEELFDEFLDSVYAAEGCGSIDQDGSQRLPS